MAVEPTAMERRLVVEVYGRGMSGGRLARILGIPEGTLRERFADELAQGRKLRAQCEWVAQMSAEGIPEEAIGRVLGMTVRELRRWHRVELFTGRKRQFVIDASALDIDQRSIAGMLGIGQEKLRTDYATEIALGRERIRVEILGSLRKAGRKGGVQALRVLARRFDPDGLGAMFDPDDAGTQPLLPGITLHVTQTEADRMGAGESGALIDQVARDPQRFALEEEAERESDELPGPPMPLLESEKKS